MATEQFFPRDARSTVRIERRYPHPIDKVWRAVTETAGFSRTSGFVDDTRAFCSIPARHDMSRRIDAGWLAQLVAEHQLDEDEAAETAVGLVTDQPRKVFRL